MYSWLRGQAFASLVLRYFPFFVISALIIRTGIWFFPNYSSSLSIIQDPFRSPVLPAEQQYIFGSWLIHVIAHFLLVKSAGQFFLLNFVFVVLFFVIAWFAIRKSYPGQLGSIAFGIFCLFPASSMIIWWVGMDALTLVLLEIIVISVIRGWWVGSIFASVLLALQHFEFGFLALVLLLVSFTVQRAKSRSILLFASIILLCLSKLIFEVALSLSRITYVSRFTWMLENLSSSVSMFVWALLPILWSLFGLLLVFKYWSGINFRQSRHIFIPMVLALVPTMASFDQTRTGAVLVFSALFYFLLTEAPLLTSKLQKINPGGLLLISLIPTLVVLSGKVQTGVFMEDIYYVIHVLFNVFDIPSDPSTWPFTN